MLSRICNSVFTIIVELQLSGAVSPQVNSTILYDGITPELVRAAQLNAAELDLTQL